MKNVITNALTIAAVGGFLTWAAYTSFVEMSDMAGSPVAEAEQNIKEHNADTLRLLDQLKHNRYLAVE